jgi:hypothetical protein
MTPTDVPASEVSKAAPKEKVRTGGFVLEWSGSDKGSWERWHLTEGEPAHLLSPEDSSPKTSSRILALPTSSFFAWPLWISTEGEPLDLIRLELAGRHLIKRGMEDSLRMLPVATLDERRLVLAIACEEPFPDEGLPENWKKADRFEIRANLLIAPDEDLLIWKENGAFHASFQREGKCVWFCGLREDLSPGVLLRASLRLLSEGILLHPIRKIRILTPEGSFARSALAAVFPHARISIESLILPEAAALSKTEDLPPAAARSERRSRQQWEMIRQIGAGAALLYALLLLWMAGDYLIHRHALTTWKQKISSLQAPATEAQQDSERWKTLRPAVDPTTYPLDLLAAIAAPTEGGKVRLTAFTMEKGRLQVSGEATDVTTAYAFIDQLKKSPALHEYDWNAGQPQIAGKNSVKFDMEGVRPDAAK